MAADFTAIIKRPQHFGSGNLGGDLMQRALIDNYIWTIEEERGVSPARFVGETHDYGFDCPSVNRDEVALLMFQSLGVEHEDDGISVNPDTAPQPSVPGGIPRIHSAEASERPTWSSNVMFVRRGTLLDEGNVLRITAAEIGGLLDDFVIDNVVLMYKTRLDADIS